MNRTNSLALLLVIAIMGVTIPSSAQVTQDVLDSISTPGEVELVESARSELRQQGQ